MSSVEIKIRGVKGVRGLKTKAKSKRGKRKVKPMAERQKMPEYSFRGRPYDYASPVVPTYIDRPLPPQLMQQQAPQIDYKPIVDKLSQQLMLANMKQQSAREQNVLAPMREDPNIQFSEVEEKKDAGGPTVEDITKPRKNLRLQETEEGLKQIKQKEKDEWVKKMGNVKGFEEYYRRYNAEILGRYGKAK